MYAALWRVLPGPKWLRALILAALAAGIVYLLFFHVFPWLGPLIDSGEVGLE